MKRTFVVCAATLAFVATLGSTPAAAQATIGWDASLFSSYVWRGLTLTSKPVLEPDLYVSFPIGAASLTVGGWANIDLGDYGGDDIAEGGGGAFNLSEFDPWAEIEFAAGPLTITPGVTAYIYPNDAPGLTSESNTVEIYGKFGLGVLLSPFVNVYYDVDKVKGAYVEGGISHDIPLGATSLSLGGLIGWTGGQEFSPDDASANFAKDGITHIDLSASVPFTAGSFEITPSIHGVFGQDDATKFTSQTSTSDFKVWGGITIGWSHGGAAEE